MTDSKMVDFFSLIPEEIHRLTVSHLLSSVEYRYDNGEQYLGYLEDLQPLLEYAKLTPSSHRAVIEAMRFKIAPWYCNTTAVNWIINFANDLQEIDLAHTIRCFFPQPLPKLPKLRKACIKTISNQLDLIRNSPTLEHLSILFENICDWDVFVSIIRSFRLKTLEMCFHENFFKPLHMLSVTELNKLKDACPYVEHLILKGRFSRQRKVYEMISGFKSLKKLSIQGAIFQKDLSYLEAHSNLELIDLPASNFDVVRILGRRVKAVSSVAEHGEKIEAIKDMESLTNLKIQTSCNFREVIKLLVNAIGNIEALAIRFSHKTVHRNGVFFRVYQKLDTHAFVGLLEKAKNLNFLCIDRISIEAKDVEDILKVVGDTLREFHVCIDWQNESAAQTIKLFLGYVTKYCPDIEILRFLEMGFGFGPAISATGAQRQSCMAALSTLSNHCGRFSSYEEIRGLIVSRFRSVAQEDNVMP